MLWQRKLYIILMCVIYVKSMLLDTYPFIEIVDIIELVVLEVIVFKGNPIF